MENKLFLIDADVNIKSFTFNNDEMYVKMQLDAEPIHLCKRCGRPLIDVESITNEMGPTCYHIYLHNCHKKSRKLF